MTMMMLVMMLKMRGVQYILLGVVLTTNGEESARESNNVGWGDGIQVIV